MYGHQAEYLQCHCRNHHHFLLGLVCLYAIFTALHWETFCVRYLPSRYTVTIEPFLLTTLKACGSYLVENLLFRLTDENCVFNWQT